MGIMSTLYLTIFSSSQKRKSPSPGLSQQFIHPSLFSGLPLLLFFEDAHGLLLVQIRDQNIGIESLNTGVHFSDR